MPSSGFRCARFDETAALAAQIADESFLNFRELRKLKSAFRPVAERCAARLGGMGDIYRKFEAKDAETYATLCRETLDVMRKHPRDADILRAGKQFLRLPEIKDFMTAQAAAGDRFYQDALGFINTSDPPQALKKQRFANLIRRP